MKTEYSVECEECNSYNISPIKCESCWRKQIYTEEVKKVKKLKEELIKHAWYGNRNDRVIEYIENTIDEIFGDKEEKGK